jgi:eukaryotic-like serine/threonine-protein kinase
MTEVWTQWVGQIVNGVYPLRRFLNASDHSAVFLTESRTEGFYNAAIKFVAADPAMVEVRLWHWKTATTFSHPHLIRLLDSGQCEIDGRPLLFVVMEYAEETLAQILPYRALSAEEVRELLVPTLDALAFLHSESWVQGQLKPSNVLVVNDQLKLAIDTIRPAGISREKATQPTSYDPPEVEQGEISQNADVWALGVTLAEALTRYPPSWPQGRSEPPALPAEIPPAFAQIIQGCLSVNPADRPSVADLQVLTRPSVAPEPAPPAPPARTEAATSKPAAEQAMRAMPPHSYSALSKSNRSDSAARRWATPAIAVVLVVLVAVWGGSRLFRGHAGSSPTAAVPRASGADASQPSAATEPAPALGAAASHEQPAPAGTAHSDATATQQQRPAAKPRPMSAEQSGSRPASGDTAVVHQEIPHVSPGARQTIHGHVRVSVRVVVNKSGAVVHDTFESASSSNYFNRVASEAARKWKFASADSDRSREWLLHFEFGREGTTVHATRSRS